MYEEEGNARDNGKAVGSKTVNHREIGNEEREFRN